MVVGLEVGGRWSPEAWDFVRLLAAAKARGSLPRLRKAVAVAWRRRWVSTVAVAAARAFASSLLELPATFGADGETPTTEAILSDARYVPGVR